MTIRNTLSYTAIILFIMAGCSIKEDRQDCPCWLQLTVDNTFSIDKKVNVVLMDRWKQAVSESVVLYMRHEIAVPRDHLWTLAFTGIEPDGLTEEMILYNNENVINPLWAYSDLVDCRGESAIDTVVLHRHFAVARLVISENSEMVGKQSYSVETSCGGIDLVSMVPIPGTWRISLNMSKDGGVFNVPRMKPEDKFVIVVRNSNGDIDEIDIQAQLKSIGYNWYKQDLDDMIILIDHIRGTVGITIIPWQKGEIYDVEI